MHATIHHGEALAVLRTLPDASVHCCVTSPPYYGLRDYGEPGQLGLESTPEAYVSRLVEIMREVRRVLRADGTCWLNLGDSYASGAGEVGRNDETPEVLARRSMIYGTGTRKPNPAPRSERRIIIRTGLKPKDIIGIPWMVAFALRAEGWYLRSDIIWAKENAMPESVTDRPTRAHEYVFLLTKSQRYFYDADAIKEDAAVSTQDRAYLGKRPIGPKQVAQIGAGMHGKSETLRVYDREKRNKRSVWTVNTVAFPEAHFAVFPPALIEPCILAGTSARGCCPACGALWTRIVEREPMEIKRSGRAAALGAHGKTAASGTMTKPATAVTRGWEPSCGCGAGEPVPCVVLDPFSGSGTTGVVATGHGRDYIGIELNADYIDITRRRFERAGAMFAELDVIQKAA